MAWPITIDFETMPILPRPEYPPIPVGVAIKCPGQGAQYLAWGHPSGNNCTIHEARAALADVWDTPAGLLFHNAKFDLDVAETHMGLPMPAWDRIHDTMFLLFLADPHSNSLALKPASEALLGMPPDERDAVAGWLVGHQPVRVRRLTMKSASEFIGLAPGNIVGPYAIGDVKRTDGLFRKLYPEIKARKMIKAYDRERRLLPILLEIERQGVRVDVERLTADVADYDGTLQDIAAWLQDRLGAINLDSAPSLVSALIASDLIDLAKLGTTPKSKADKPTYKSDKVSLQAAVTDPLVSAMLQYRAQCSTCLNTFMRNWLYTAQQSGGLIYTQWNQIRSEGAGARTGRMSSSPNFMNIPKKFTPIFDHDEPGKGLPVAPWPIPALPLVRSYVIPSAEDHILLDRDYSQQELRVLGHFEDGPLREAYCADPWMDIHDKATELINQMLGTDFDRKPVKTIGFGLIYGMGLALLADRAGITSDQARNVKAAYLQIFPGLKDLQDGLKDRARDNQPIRTWGGREYFVEPPIIVDGRIRTHEYKLLNVLVQGSSADCTKDAIIAYWAIKSPDAKLLLSVHDEILISAPLIDMAEAMEELREAMEGIKFDVPMLSDGKAGLIWSDMRAYDKKGVQV